MSVYVGVVEAARDLALRNVTKRRKEAETWYLMGELENAFATGQMAVQGMTDLCADYAFKPDLSTASAIRQPDRPAEASRSEGSLSRPPGQDAPAG